MIAIKKIFPALAFLAGLSYSTLGYSQVSYDKEGIKGLPEIILKEYYTQEREIFKRYFTSIRLFDNIYIIK